MKIVLAILFWISIQSCTSTREAVMPFRNFAYSGERLFPIQENSSETIFRIWINNGTSLDRVITISRDTLFKDQGILIEFGIVEKKGPFKDGPESFFKSKKIIPKSGFDGFFKKLDSLNIIDLKNQTKFQSSVDQPFSLYVVEYKKSGKYNQFRFNTLFPHKSEADIYLDIQKLIFSEFDWEFYFK